MPEANSKPIETAPLLTVLTTAVDRSRSMPRLPAVGEHDPTLGKIHALLQERPELQGNVMVQTGLSSVRLLMILPRLLLSRAVTHGPEDAVRWLEKLLGTSRVTLLAVMPLWGIDVSEIVDLTPSVRLVPLPETSGAGGLEYQRFDFFAPMYALQQPRTALVVRTTRDLFLHDAEKDSVPYDSSVDDLLHDVRLCLTLVAPCGIVAAAQSFRFEDPDFSELALWSGRHWRAQELQPTVLPSFGNFSPQRAQTLVLSVENCRIGLMPNLVVSDRTPAEPR